ncbi:MAG: response regulator transcription factor [Candidatus Bipolaricaulota bacterium]
MIRIVIADDHALVREGLTRLLSRCGCQVVGQASGAEEGLQLVRKLSPDVVLWDLIMPGGGLDTLRALPGTVRVLVLTAVDDVLLACEVARAGADGFLPKTSSPEKLTEAIARVARGETVFPPLPELSPRELEVLEHLGRGAPNPEIARSLGLSVKTVESHVERLKAKLGKESAAELRAWAARR